jgi:hypothetical protein
MSTHLTSKTSCTGAKTCTSAKMLWLGPSWINSHPGQKWWQTVLEIEISCSQWEASACTQSASILFYFFLCSEHVPIRFPIASRFKSVSMFYLLSQCVPIEFPSSSQSVPQDVPEALHFYMIWFASSWTFLCIYISLSIKEGSLFCFVVMRSTELRCFRSCSWCLWKALDEEGCMGLVPWPLDLWCKSFWILNDFFTEN